MCKTGDPLARTLRSRENPEAGTSARLERAAASATAESREARVWAIDTRHLPLYWFARKCPRGTFWATARTTFEDSERLGGSSRVHLVEAGWLDRMRSARVVAYRLPDATFAPDPEVGG